MENKKISLKPKDVIQGYGVTVAKYKVSLYQKRMMLAITNAAQAKIDGEKNIVGRNFIVQDGEFPIIEIPAEMILQDEDSKNLYAVRQAAKQIMKSVIEYEVPDYGYILFAPIIMAEIPKHSSSIYLQVHKLFWQAILDYRRGFRKFDTKLALTFKSVYSIRFFEMISGKKEAITYTIDELKGMFQVSDRYKQINDFLKRVIMPAKKELDESAPYSFDFAPVKTGRKITAIKFTPVFYPERGEDAKNRELQRRLNLSWDIRDRKVREYLLTTIGFTTTEIKNNIEVFRRASELIPDFLLELSLLHGKSRDKKNPKGWIVNSLKGKVNDILKKLDKEKSQLPHVKALADKFNAK